MFEITVSDFQTGEEMYVFTAEETPSACTWGTVANGFESGQTTFELGAAQDLSYSDWHELIDPWRRTVDVAWKDDEAATPHLVFSGLMMGLNYNRPKQQLTVASAEVRALLARRFLFGVGTYEIGTRSINNRSMQGQIYQILKYATQGSLSSVWNVPLYFPPIPESGPHSQDYWNYLFQNAEQMITAWQDADGGPDLHFEARKTGKVRDWVVRTGTPRLTGPIREFFASGDEQNAFNVTQATDGSMLRTGTFAVGNGSEEDILHGEAATVAVPGGYPSLDVVDQHKQIDDIPTLDSLAAAAVEATRTPVMQTSFDVLARDFLGPDGAGARGTVGSPIDLISAGDKWMPPDRLTQYCIAYSGDMSETIKLQMQGV